MAKVNEAVRIELAVSGMSEEGISLIMEYDHRVELSERYYEENRSYAPENERKRKSENDKTKDDPIECLPDYTADVHGMAFPEKRILDPRIAELLVALKSLSEDQVNLIYDLYGNGFSLEEIAQRDGVTRQAIYSRKNTILKKLKKMLEEG